MNFGTSSVVLVRGRTRAGLRTILSDDPPISSQRNNHRNTQQKQSNSGQDKTDGEVRNPEIQMINKFYGLIPKKFLFSERIQPSISHARYKSSIRPKTTKPTTAFLDPSEAASKRLRRNRRCSSVEETKTDQTVDTPLVTRRISLERSTPMKVPPIKIPEDIIGAENQEIPKVQPQRVVKIDLRELKWEEPETDDEACTCSLSKKGPLDSESDSRPSRKKRTKDGESPTPSDPEGQKPEASQTMPEEGPENVLASYWTTGKTTAERRAKLQKTFSIHPSFNKFSLEQEDSTDGAESEGPTYPESMSRTSRRSLHVTLQEDVETMISSSRKSQQSRSKSHEEPHVVQGIKSATPVVTVSTFQKLSTPVSPSPTVVALPGKVPGQTKVMSNRSLDGPPLKKEAVVEEKISGTLSAHEKRKLFSQRFSSLPSSSHSKVESPKRSGGPRAPLIRQSSSPAATKLAIKSGSGKSFAKFRTGGLTNERFVRPKTAPIHSTPPTTTSRENLGTTRTKNRRQPLRATGQIAVVSKESGTKDVHADSSIIKMNKEAPKICKKENKVIEIDSKEPPPPPGTPAGNRFSPKIGSRRSFSLDEASLVNYSTSIPDSIESDENSLQSTKRREECLRIYEKMKRSGCVVRLHTIFRGLMTPSEYRTFITAAEKATMVAPSGDGNNGGDDGIGTNPTKHEDSTELTEFIPISVAETKPEISN